MLIAAFIVALLAVTIGMTVMSIRTKKVGLQLSLLFGAIVFAILSIYGSVSLYEEGQINTAHHMCLQTALSENTINQLTIAEMRQVAQNGVPSVIVKESLQAEVGERCFASMHDLAMLQAKLADEDS